MIYSELKGSTPSLLGFGAMGKTHAYAIKNLPFFYGAGYDNDKIVALASGHYENAVKAVEEFSLGRAYVSEDEIINDPNIDIVDICTPNIYHYETVKKALMAGKHVYCEKPLAVTYDEAKELCDLAESRGLTCRIVFNNRFMPAVMRAKEIVESGRLGKVVTFRVAYLHASCIDPNKKAGWKQDRDILPCRPQGPPRIPQSQLPTFLQVQRTYRKPPLQPRHLRA